MKQFKSDSVDDHVLIPCVVSYQSKLQFTLKISVSSEFLVVIVYLNIYLLRLTENPHCFV